MGYWAVADILSFSQCQQITGKGIKDANFGHLGENTDQIFSSDARKKGAN
jgi:hypothetical protein